MKTILAVALAACLVGSASTATAQHYLLDYYGFTQQTGSVISGVGFVDQILPPLTSSPSTYQYTYAWDNLTVASVTPIGKYRLYVIVGGSFRIYEDASFNAWYNDSACPTVTTLSAPGTFSDGVLFLEAQVDTLIHQFNTFTGVGSFTGTLRYVGGSHLSELRPDGRSGTVFGGTTNKPIACVPVGYSLRWDGQAFYTEPPIAAGRDSWGSVKALYR
jgi:hypothetical protein